RALGIGRRAVAGIALVGGAHPADALLGDLDRIERAAEEVERKRTDLAEHVFRTHFVGMLLDEEQAPVRARGLLVGDGGEDDVAQERDASIAFGAPVRHGRKRTSTSTFSSGERPRVTGIAPKRLSARNASKTARTTRGCTSERKASSHALPSSSPS